MPSVSTRWCCSDRPLLLSTTMSLKRNIVYNPAEGSVHPILQQHDLLKPVFDIFILWKWKWPLLVFGNDGMQLNTPLWFEEIGGDVCRRVNVSEGVFTPTSQEAHDNGAWFGHTQPREEVRGVKRWWSIATSFASPSHMQTHILQQAICWATWMLMNAQKCKPGRVRARTHTFILSSLFLSRLALTSSFINGLCLISSQSVYVWIWILNKKNRQK